MIVDNRNQTILLSDGRRSRSQSVTAARKAVARPILAAATLLLLSSCAARTSSHAPSHAHDGQQHFASPEIAVDTLVSAAERDDVEGLTRVLSADAEDILSSGDPIADRAGRQQFVERSRQRADLDKRRDGSVQLVIGNDEWPFPIPLVRDRQGWYFDTEEGREEIINRRIGRNELRTIGALLGVVDAQRDYARRLRASKKPVEFAQKLRSTKGRRDGLYWETAPGQPQSPMGPMLAEATAEGYRPGAPSGPAPFHGYLYKILTAQGASQSGGARSYLRGGRLRNGFALAAYPAHYGVSGVTTFVVNQVGIVFEKDLGEDTAAIASAMSAYDPDDSWRPAQPLLVDDIDDIE